MIDSKTLTKVVARMIAKVTGLPESSISISQNFSAPKGSYCSVRLQSPLLWGQAMKTQREVVAEDDPQYMDIIDQTRTQLELSFSVNFYRDKAMDYAAALHQANKREPVKSLLRSNSMVDVKL